MNEKDQDKQIGENKISIETIVALVQNDISYIKEKLEGIEDKLDHKYVSKEEFRPVRMIVYGSVGAILLVVVGALMAVILESSVGGAATSTTAPTTSMISSVL